MLEYPEARLPHFPSPPALQVLPCLLVLPKEESDGMGEKGFSTRSPTSAHLQMEGRKSAVGISKAHVLLVFFTRFTQLSNLFATRQPEVPLRKASSSTWLSIDNWTRIFYPHRQKRQGNQFIFSAHISSFDMFKLPPCSLRLLCGTAFPLSFCKFLNLKGCSANLLECGWIIISISLRDSKQRIQ